RRPGPAWNAGSPATPTSGPCSHPPTSWSMACAAVAAPGPGSGSTCTTSRSPSAPRRKNWKSTTTPGAANPPAPPPEPAHGGPLGCGGLLWPAQQDQWRSRRNAGSVLDGPFVDGDVGVHVVDVPAEQDLHGLVPVHVGARVDAAQR